MSGAIIMNLRYTPVKHILMRRGIMQIIVAVLISLAEWYATLGPHLFHFKSLGLLAMPLDNDNVVLYGVNYPCEWNRTFCMIQHKILAFRR